MKNLNEAFVSLKNIQFVDDGEGGNRLVTDRFILWRSEELPPKQATLLRGVPQGIWDLTASGQFKPAASGLTPTVKYAGIDSLLEPKRGSRMIELKRSSIILEGSQTALTRVYVDEAEGNAALLNNKLNLEAYRLFLEYLGEDTPSARIFILNSKEETVGLAMTLRPPNMGQDLQRITLAALEALKKPLGSKEG